MRWPRDATRQVGTAPVNLVVGLAILPFLGRSINY